MHFKQEQLNKLLDKIWERLDKMWLKGLTYQSGQTPEEVLQRLLEDPKTILAKDELQDFSRVQKMLQDSESTDTCQLALNFSILYAQNLYNDKEENIAELIRKQLVTDKIVLDSEKFDLAQLNERGWIALRNVLSKFSVIELLFREMFLNNEQYKAFFTFIATIPHLTVLCFSGDNTHSYDVWMSDLLEAIGKVLKIDRLEFNGLIRAEHIGVLSKLIDTFSARRLVLGYNDLETFSGRNWITFWSAVNSSKLESLIFETNALPMMNEDQWEAFCDGIAKAHLEKFLIGEDQMLSKFSLTQLEKLFHSLAHSMISTITLYERIDFKNSQWEKIIELFQENFTLRMIKLAKDAPLNSAMEKLLERNIHIYNCQSEARALLNKIETSKREIGNDVKKSNSAVEEINNVCAKLQKSLDIIQDKKSPSAKRNRDQIIQLLNNLHWQKANLLSYTKETKDAVDSWLDITPESEHYQQARMNAFEAVYTHNVFVSETEYSKSTKISAEQDVLKQKKAVFSRLAFLQALPCLVDVQQHTQQDNQNSKMQFIKLTIDQQRLFDNFLFAAVGGYEGGFHWQPTPNERLALLQYVTLLDIASTESVLLPGLNKRRTFLKKLNLLPLNNIHPKSCGNEREQKILLNLWCNFMVLVENISEEDYPYVKFMDTGKEIIIQNHQDLKLVKAISALAASILATAKTSSQTEFFKGKKRLASSAIATEATGTPSLVEECPSHRPEDVDGRDPQLRSV